MRRKIFLAGAGALGGLVYGGVVVHLALLSSGAGQGTTLPIGLSIAPLFVVFFFSETLASYGVILESYVEFGGVIVWMLMGFLATAEPPLVRRFWFPLLALTHYVVGWATCLVFAGLGENTGWEAFHRTWDKIPVALIAWSTAYVLGHVILWLTYFLVKQDSSRDPSVSPPETA
jgi:hypothetical protein